MKRTRLLTLSLSSVLALVALALPAAAAGQSPPASGAATRASAAQAYHDSLCQSHSSLCADAYTTLGDEYVGHDEPSVLFKSGIPGSGNDITYVMTLPTEPKAQPSGVRRRWRYLELPAEADILVRLDAVRHRVCARVHQDLHARLRRQRPGRDRSGRAGLHRQASW